MAARVGDRAGARSGGWPLLAAALVLAVAAASARADNVDVLLGELENGRDYKVRLGAALSLTKLADPRAIPAFVAALDDSDKAVRAAAVVGLGKLVDESTPEATRKQVLAAVDKVAKGDPADATTKRAIKLRDTLAKLGGGAAVVQGGMFIDIADMKAKFPGDEGKALGLLMRTTAEKGLRRLDPGIMLTWPGGKPTQQDLDRAKARGYYLDGNILEVTVTEKGSATLVTCKLSMLIATHPGRSIFGFLEGGAKVQGSNTAKDIALAKQDCVTAVVEDLVAKKIMPTIRTKAGPNQ